MVTFKFFENFTTYKETDDEPPNRWTCKNPSREKLKNDEKKGFPFLYLTFQFCKTYRRQGNKELYSKVS